MAGKSPKNEAGPSTSNEEIQNVFPAARVRMIMKSAPETLPPNPEGVFMMSKAVEHFVRQMVQNTYTKYTSKTNHVFLDYSHLAEYTQANDDLDFLHEILPRKITAREAFKILHDQAETKLPAKKWQQAPSDSGGSGEESS